jgi:TorA maturation chaperone TorD
MSDSENFLSRWSRLKHESEVASPDTGVPSPAPAPPAFDPASLPPIESIVADSDIRQYLHANVPPELTRAALRSAWAADPAIRDFIGIAESQWDFNDPAAIPGFGPLQAADHLAARALGSLSDDAPVTPDSPGPVSVEQLALPAGQPALPASELLDEVDIARAQEYSLLSNLLAHSPDARMLSRLAELRGDESPLGLAHTALANAATRTDAEMAAREHFTLFVGLGRGELLPYASYYLTGFLHGRPLAKLRQALQRIGIERKSGQTEPEDHAAILLEIMAGLASGDLPAPKGTDREIFDDHLAPWITRFFSDLEKSASADFYAAVGALGRTFTQIEAQSFLMPQ